MDENNSIPLEQVIKAPRLASVKTTIEELKNAIESGSDSLIIVSNADGTSSLKRRDNCKFFVNILLYFLFIFDIMIHILFKFINSDPGALSGANPLLQADSTRASFDSRGGNSERPTPAASANPEIDNSIPLQLSMLRFPPPSSLDPMIYQTQHPFYQPPNRPASVTAPSVNPNAAVITQLSSFMSAMNFGQPGQPNPQAAAATGNPLHPSVQQANQFFNSMNNFNAAFAALNARTSGFQLPAPFPPNLFPSNPVGQPQRTGGPAPPAGNIPQPFFTHHQQQAVAAQRRVSPPPHANTVPTQQQQQAPANVSAANVLNIQLPGAAPPLYNIHNPHDAHFAPGSFPPTQSYDSAWLTESTAALMNSGNFSHLGYPTPSVMSGAPIMAWPPNQPPPPQIRSTQHHPIHQPSNYQLYSVPPANLLPNPVTAAATGNQQPAVSTVATTAATIDNAKTTSASSNTVATATTNSSTPAREAAAASSSASSSKDESNAASANTNAVATANENSTSAPVKKHSVSSNHQQQASGGGGSAVQQQQHSRPNSSGSNKGNKYNSNKSAAGKGGGAGGGQHHHHHHTRGHNNRAPGSSMGPVSSAAAATASTNSSTSTSTVASNSNAVAASSSSPSAK